MKKVHGTFHSLEDLRTATQAKPKNRKEKKKCEICGGELRNVADTNVWVCDTVTLTDEKLRGKPVQVFTPCRGSIFSAI